MMNKLYLYFIFSSLITSNSFSQDCRKSHDVEYLSPACKKKQIFFYACAPESRSVSKADVTRLCELEADERGGRDLDARSISDYDGYCYKPAPADEPKFTLPDLNFKKSSETLGCEESGCKELIEGIVKQFKELGVESLDQEQSIEISVKEGSRGLNQSHLAEMRQNKIMDLLKGSLPDSTFKKLKFKFPISTKKLKENLIIREDEIEGNDSVSLKMSIVPQKKLKPGEGNLSRVNCSHRNTSLKATRKTALSEQQNSERLTLLRKLKATDLVVGFTGLGDESVLLNKECEMTDYTTGKTFTFQDLLRTNMDLNTTEMDRTIRLPDGSSAVCTFVNLKSSSSEPDHVSVVSMIKDDGEILTYDVQSEPKDCNCTNPKGEKIKCDYNRDLKPKWDEFFASKAGRRIKTALRHNYQKILLSNELTRSKACVSSTDLEQPALKSFSQDLSELTQAEEEGPCLNRHGENIAELDPCKSLDSQRFTESKQGPVKTKPSEDKAGRAVGQ